jgi:hypothetical protein
MGTDRFEHRKPCPCGKGTILVVCTSPDHPYASIYSVHWDCEIECPDCMRDYIVERDRGIMRRSDGTRVMSWSEIKETRPPGD